MHRKDNDSPTARVPLPTNTLVEDDIELEASLNEFLGIVSQNPPIPSIQSIIPPEDPLPASPLLAPQAVHSLPSAEDDVYSVPLSLSSAPIAPRDKLFDLIDQPDNIEEVQAYIDSISNMDIVFSESSVVIDSEQISSDSYSYALYQKRYDILRHLIAVLARDHGIIIIALLLNAISLRHPLDEIVLLIEAGADIYSPAKDNSRLDIIDFIYISNRVDVLDFLVNTQRLNLASDLQRRPHRLHLAVASGADLIVEKLLLSGVMPNVRIDSRSYPVNMEDLGELTPMEILLRSDVTGLLKLKDLYNKHLSVCKFKANFSRTIMLMLDKGAECHVTTQLGENLFHLLARTRIDRLCAERLLKAGLDINQQSKNGCTALFGAAFNGDIDTVEVLLALGANPNIKDSDGRYPIYYSKNIAIFKMLRPHYETVELAAKFIDGDEVFALIFSGDQKNGDPVGFDESQVDVYMDQLMEAVEAKDPRIVKNILQENPSLINFLTPMRNGILMRLIIFHPTDIDIFRLFLSIHSNAELLADQLYNKMFKSAMRSKCSMDIVQLLLSVSPQSAVMSISNQCPVMLACRYDRLDVLQALEARGADIHMKLQSGLSTFHVACQVRSADVALYLKKKGADVHAKFLQIDNAREYTAMQVLQAMLDYEQSSFRPDPVCLDKMAEHIKILRALNYNFFGNVDALARYYTANMGMISSDDDLNPLLEGYLDKWDLVSSKIPSIKVHVLSLGLITAALYGAVKNVQTHLRLGAQINFTDNAGATPLHWSVLYKREAVTKILMAAGADVTQRTALGNTPLQCAYNAFAKQNAIAYLKSFLPTAEPLLLSPVSIAPPSQPVSDRVGTETWQLTLNVRDFSNPDEIKALDYALDLREWPIAAPNLSEILGKPPSKTFVISQIFSEGYYCPGRSFTVHHVQAFTSPSQVFTFEGLVCLEARNIANTLENTNLCREALFDLSAKGFRGMQTLKLDQHFATPGLKLLYDHRDQNTPVGVFVRCNLLAIQRARKEILYKALIAHSLFKVCPNADIVNRWCDTLTHDDIPHSDEQSSALMKMLPGTCSAKNQSGPKS